MTERPHYRNAPIIEATISLGIVPPVGLSTEDLIKIRELVQDRYPDTGEEYLYTREMRVDEPREVPEHDDTHEHIGYAFRSKDWKHIVSVRLDGFDFSVGPPYSQWEEFREEAQRLWTLFRKISGVTEVVRIAVRYINRIDIPATNSVKLD